MNISEIMTGGVDLMDPDTTAREAAKRLRDADVGALPVGKDDRLVGMITDRDIAVRGVAGDKDPDKSIVDEIMSESVYYCFEDEDASRAAEVMAEHQVGRLPVLNRNKRLVGLVALADLVKAGVADKALRGVSETSF